MYTWRLFRHAPVHQPLSRVVRSKGDTLMNSIHHRTAFLSLCTLTIWKVLPLILVVSTGYWASCGLKP